MDRCRSRAPRRAGAALCVLLAAAGCSANSTSAGGTTAASLPGSSASSSGSASGTTAAAGATVSVSASTIAASTTTIVVDLGDLDKTTFCSLATSVTDATGAFVAGATADGVKTAFASMKSSLATLADRGAPAQRTQFAAAVTVLGKADTMLAANGYDVAKTQSELSAIDPDGALIGAVTVVLTQRQAVCGP